MSKHNNSDEENLLRDQISELEQQNRQYIEAYSVLQQRCTSAETIIGSKVIEIEQYKQLNQQLQNQVNQLQEQLNNTNTK